MFYVVRVYPESPMTSNYRFMTGILFKHESEAVCNRVQRGLLKAAGLTMGRYFVFDDEHVACPSIPLATELEYWQSRVREWEQYFFDEARQCKVLPSKSLRGEIAFQTIVLDDFWLAKSLIFSFSPFHQAYITFCDQWLALFKGVTHYSPCFYWKYTPVLQVAEWSSVLPDRTFHGPFLWDAWQVQADFAYDAWREKAW